MLNSLLCIFLIDIVCILSHYLLQQQPDNTVAKEFCRDGGLFLDLGKILGEANQCDLAAPFFLLLLSLDQMGFLLTGSNGTSCGVKYYITSVQLQQSGPPCAKRY